MCAGINAWVIIGGGCVICLDPLTVNNHAGALPFPGGVGQAPDDSAGHLLRPATWYLSGGSSRGCSSFCLLSRADGEPRSPDRSAQDPVGAFQQDGRRLHVLIFKVAGQPRAFIFNIAHHHLSHALGQCNFVDSPCYKFCIYLGSSNSRL